MSYDSAYDKNIQEIVHYIAIKRYNLAKDKIFSGLSECPNDGELLYLMSICSCGLDKYDEALDYCKQALENNYSVVECYELLGRINTDLGKYDKAEEYYLEALSIDPQSAQIIACYALVMLKTGFKEKGAKLLEEARRISPDDSEVLKTSFYYYLVNDKKRERLKVLERYLDVSDDEISKLVKVGLNDLYIGNYKSAKENFRQAFVLDPTDNDLLLAIQELEIKTNPFFLPLRLVDKVGGPAVIWVVFILCVIVLSYYKIDKVLMPIAIIYILFAVYTWIAAAIFKIVFRWRNKRG